MNLKQLLSEMTARRASDIHLRVGVKPILRVDGQLVPIDSEELTRDKVEEFVKQILSKEQLDRFYARNEMDLALSVAQMGRFRVNLYRQRGTVGLAFRAVNTVVPTFSELHLPEVIKKLCSERRGLIIVTGTTGSGKSTTLAAMIEQINNTRAENILTIEDPIEYVYQNRRSYICQREVGGDTESFGAALRHAFRQDPDVILIGEIRDLETMSIALTAADTGHLVLTTLHTLDAVETISRVVSFFPPHQHQQVRLLLAGTLKAIISQRLLSRSDQQGRVPAVEVLIGTGAICDALLDETKTKTIHDLVQDGQVQYGMQTFDQSIMKLHRAGMISYEEAMNYATNPDDFDLRVRGITGASDRGWSEVSRAQS